MIHLLIGLYGVLTTFPCFDEVAHLPAGVSHWRFEHFDLYRVNPPLVRLVAGFPAWIANNRYAWGYYSVRSGDRPEFSIGMDRLSQVELEIQKEFLFPRALCLSFSVAGALVLFIWLYQALGLFVANIGCIAFYFCPNLLAFAPTIEPDVGAAAMGLLACFACWKYLCWSRIDAVLLAGGALGLALLTKLTWLTAVVALPITMGIVLLIFRIQLQRKSIKQYIGDLVVFLCMALFTLNLGYLFEGTFKPLGEHEFCSEMLGGPGCNVSVHGNRFKGTWLSSLPIPVPRNYLLGIDYLKYEVETKKWSFLLGEWKFGSWPHYYIMTTLFKTPEPTLLAALIGSGTLLVGIRRKMVEPKVITMFMFLGIPAVVAFASVSLQGGFNHHHRYVLQIYPFLFALAAYVASPVAVKLLQFRLPFLGPNKRSIAIPLAVTLTVLMMASSLRVHPHYTSYFNTLSGGPENGWRLLGFSNIDWGQDLLLVDKWIKEHPDCRPLVFNLDYFDIDGDLFDLPNSSPPQLPKGASIDEVRTDETQWWIISVKKLYNLPDHNGLEYLQQLEPVDKIAYAYHVYRIAPRPAPLEPAAR